GALALARPLRGTRRPAGAKVPVRDQTQDIDHHRGADQRGVARLIVGWGYLDHIAPDEVQAPQAAEQPLGLERRDAPDFRRPGARRVHRIEAVHVEGDVGGAVAHHAAGLFDDALDAELGKLLDEDHAHAVRAGAFDAIHEILAPADADLNRAPGVEHPRLAREAKRGAGREFRAKELS